MRNANVAPFFRYPKILCCGSGMDIPDPDFTPSQFPDSDYPHPGSATLISYTILEKFKMLEI